MDKIKKFVNDHNYEIAVAAALPVVSIVVFTLVCKRNDFHMMKPYMVSDTHVYAKSLRPGRLYRSPILSKEEVA